MSTPIPSDIAQHLNYQSGMFLTASEMTLEQNYFINWFRLQNQYLYTPGVLNGMLVSQAGNALSVAQGVGFDPLGNFLIVPSGGSPVSVPANPISPFIVYAIYPDNSAAKTDVVNTAAKLKATDASTNLPSNAIALASVTLDANNVITAVADVRVPVSSRLPANLQPPSNQPNTRSTGLNLQAAQQGKLSIPTDNLGKAGSRVTQEVPYLDSGEDAFSSPPHVGVTVLGDTPYALAVQPGTAHFALTLTALQAPQAPTLELSWIALPTA